MNKTQLIALLFVAIVTVSAATPTILRKSTAIPDAPKQTVDEKRVEYTTTITAEQAKEINDNLNRATYEQANKHLTEIVRKK